VGSVLYVLGGLVLAAGLGWLLSLMLVAMLQHVFDPPPDHLAIPWGYLAGLGGAALVATTIPAGELRRLPLRGDPARAVGVGERAERDRGSRGRRAGSLNGPSLEIGTLRVRTVPER
jgi:hypothetical protein